MPASCGRRSDALSRVAPTAVSELADIDLAISALEQADAELADFGVEVAGQDFLDQLAIYEARKPWSELTTAEKVEAVAEGGDMATMMKFGADGFHYDPDAKTDDDPKWNAMSMAEKIAAVQQATEDGESVTSLIN